MKSRLPKTEVQMVTTAIDPAVDASNRVLPGFGNFLEPYTNVLISTQQG
jgi:hypothetical protein